MRKLSFLFLVVCLFVFSASAFGQNVVKNGTFEEGPQAPFGSWSTFNGGTTFANWTVGGGSVDLHSGEAGQSWKFAAGGGRQAVDLTGGGQSSISQSLTTAAGHYKLRFDMAANLACDGTTKQLQVSIGTYSFIASYTSNTNSFNMAWDEHSYEIDLTGPTTLTFQSLTGNGCGPAVDNVYVGLIPNTLNRSSWQMYRNPVVTGTPNYSPNHGDVRYYDYAPAIPAVDANVNLGFQVNANNGGWTPAPNGDTIAFGNGNASRLQGACWTSVDFTFFQTLVDVPSNMTLNTFTIAFQGMDDGSRVSIINSKYPLGVVIPGSYVFLGGSGTANLASFVVPGETNRVIITQMDDCAVGNQLNSATVVINNSVAAPNVPFPPPFTNLFNTPANGCICTPLLMNTDVTGTQYWWVKAKGGIMNIFAIAQAVNSTDPETVQVKIYNPGNVLVTTLTTSYPAGQSPGTEFPTSFQINNTVAGDIYRVEVRTPNTPSTQAHYRLRFFNADAAGTNSPSSPSFEHSASTWYFNTVGSELFQVNAFVTGTPSSSSVVNYTLIDPNGVTTVGSVTATPGNDGIITSPFNTAVPGIWTLKVDPSEHYGLNKPSGADRGIYLGWKSAGTGTLSLRTTFNGNPFTNNPPVTFVVKNSAGATIGTFVGNSVDITKLPADTYTITTTPPPFWNMSPSSTVNVFCDTPSFVTFPMTAQTSVVTAAASGPYRGTAALSATLTNLATGQPIGGQSLSFTVNGNSVGSALTDANGVASIPAASLGTSNAFTYPTGVRANFTGSVPNLAGSSGTAQLTITPLTPLVVVTSNVNPSNYGSPVIITATVTATAGTPSGFILFYDGTTSNPLTAGPISLSPAGVASFTTNNLSAGAHTILANYNPSTSNYLPNQGQMVQNVNGPAAIPFSQILPKPAGACICTPDIMNTGATGEQHWFAYASGTSMTATVVGISVNDSEPGTVVMKVFDAAGTTQIGSDVTVNYPVGSAPGTETSASATFATTPNTVYRFVISTPNSSPMQPHYRLKWDGAAEAGMASPGVNSLEEVHGDLGDVQRWYVNVGNGEQLTFGLLKPAFWLGTMGTATQATVRVYNMTAPGVPVPLITGASPAANSLHLTLPNLPGIAGFQSAAPLPAGIYAIVLSDVDGHFRMNKGSGLDRGLYVGWDTGHQGIVKFTVNSGNVPFSGQVGITVSSPLTGDVVAQGEVGVDGFEDTADVGHYHLEFTAPAGYVVVPSFVDIDITCDKLTQIDLKIYAVTSTNVSAPGITYNADGSVQVTVDSPVGPVTSGSVTLTVDGGSAQTLALVGGAANFNVGVLNAGNHDLVATYSDVTDGHFLGSSNNGTLTVDKADSTVTVTCSTVTYNGAAQTPCSAVVTGAGGLNATLTPTYSNNIDAGTNTASASASFAGDDNHNPGTGSANFTILKASSTTTVTCPVSVPYNATAQTPCSAVATGVGNLSASVTPTYTNNVIVGQATASATYAGDNNHESSTGSANFNITQIGSSTTISTSVNPSLLGTMVTFTAKVTVAAGAPTGTVTFTDGATVIGTASVGAGGIAVFQTSLLAVGSHPIVATYGGDNNFTGSASTPLNQIVYAFAGTGAFVIGDVTAAPGVGTSVMFWGAQWEKNNALSGPKANASFKGFANRTSTPPAAGTTWFTDPGNSSNPPATVPAYMGVIVASTDVKNGSTISGNTVKIVVVKTNAGYDDNPGHAGTGTIISILP
jgi:hypothetical protein